LGPAPGRAGAAVHLSWKHRSKEIHMPIILWLLGVPLTLILLLMLFGVF
jgi:hypothetical protein